MKHSIKISVLAIVALFAFNTVANAQFNTLLRSAKKAVTKKQPMGGSTDKNGQLLFNGNPVNMTYKEVTVRNWKTGEMETIENICKRGNGQPDKPMTSQEIYKEEQNFQDKDMKAKIINAFMEDEQFNDRKRAADDMLKSRKVVDVLFKFRDWKINRDKWDNITDRYMFVYVVSELTNGYTIVEDYSVKCRYEGAGTYSNSFIFSFYEDYWKAANKPGFTVPHRYMVTDWEHKAE